VRVESLARTLGVTKGGFYGYFADRDALLTEILDAWERESVDAVIARVEADGGDAVARLRRLSTLAGDARGEALRTDLAVRDWARREPRVARRLQRVDNRRMAYLRTLFAPLAADDADVEARALLFYSLWVGSHFIGAEHPGRTRADVVRLALARLAA
jgi:AcrR family transcriptional regulator